MCYRNIWCSKNTVLQYLSYGLMFMVEILKDNINKIIKDLSEEIYFLL